MILNTKYVFFGTPEFAAIILEKLIGAGMPPALVICNPDRPVGRKKIITPPPVKFLILEHKTWNIPVIQPEKFDESFKFLRQSRESSMPTSSSIRDKIGTKSGQVSSFKPDFAVVAAYSKILSEEIIEMPRLGTIGVHPSLLPKYRGATPIQTAILNGDKETGVTLFLLDGKVDHGAILENKKLEIRNEDTYKTLMEKLAELSADLLIEILPKFVKGEIKPKPQNESEATYTKKLSTADAFVDFDKENLDVLDRKIRALNPEPGVWTMRNGKRIKIISETTVQFEGGKPKDVTDAVTFLKSL